ncbi:MAG: alpha/beta hydrolase [Planctomycetia bacterium]|nr:alpha/beta hydrolase [Planctomycetia bacterium]
MPADDASAPEPPAASPFSSGHAPLDTAHPDRPEPRRRGRPVLRVLTWLLLGLLGLVAVAGIAIAAAWGYYHPAMTVETGVVYGERRGDMLTYDVVRPAASTGLGTAPNGLGIVYFTSGGWRSGGPGDFSRVVLAPLLRRGYTVFPVHHVSQPTATIREIVADSHRAVRAIRARAADHGIDPDRIGVTGGSAGGHLALMVATRGGPGDPAASDPIDRLSSAVQAVAIFYPVTDLLDLGTSTENPGDGGPPKSFRAGLEQDPVDLERWRVSGRELSPLFFLVADLPPTLIYHGDADTLVPLDQSQRFQARAREVGATVDLVVHRGGGHGWPTMLFDLIHFGRWFDRHLRPGR